MNNATESLTKPTNDKDIKRYTDGQKNYLEADFLLLDKTAQTVILEHFNTPDINTFLSIATIPQLWTLELLILDQMTANELTRRVWIIREKFKSQCGEDVFQRYYNGLPPSIQDTALMQDAPLETAQMQLLRDDIVSIARQLQRLGYIRIRRSESINERKRYVIKCTLLIIMLGILGFSLLKTDLIPIDTEDGKNGAKFILLIIGSGITGTAISMLQRIEKASNTPPAITDSIHDATQITLSMSNWYITSLLVSGAIFALLVHFISVAQLVNVLDILPTPSASDLESTDGISSLMQLMLPPNNKKDVAKLLLACFLSGFAERLVPDILDSLVKKTEKISK